MKKNIKRLKKLLKKKNTIKKNLKKKRLEK